ncbi:MAG: hypothetical protein AAFX50_02735 [Acidobacteriota bacterium]
MTTQSTFAHGPGGLRRTENHHDLSDERRVHLDSDGRIFKSINGKLEEIKADGDPVSDGDAPAGQATGPGWVTFASWTPETDVTGLEGTWTVPEAPADPTGQILFIHIGLQGKLADKDVIAPVVLQWGKTPFGGGDGWSIACWLQVGELLMVGNYVDLAPGDTVQAKVLHSHTAGKDLWHMEAATGGTPATLVFTLDDSLTDQITYGGSLEAYAVDMSCDQYPASPSLSFGELQVKNAGGSLTPDWQAEDCVTDCGQHTQVVDPATVQILFRS